MKKICFINGSLRGKKATSLDFINEVARRLGNKGYSKEFVTVRTGIDKYPPEIFNSIAGADAIIMVFPLFAYSLPGTLIRLLEDYYEYIKSGNIYNKNASFYVIVNCASPVPAVNLEAVRVVKNFCRRLSLNFRFAVCVGGGPAVALTKKVPFLDLKLKKAFLSIVQDIRDGSQIMKDDFLIKPIIPKAFMLMIKNQIEKKSRERFKKLSKIPPVLK